MVYVIYWGWSYLNEIWYNNKNIFFQIWNFRPLCMTNNFQTLFSVQCIVHSSYSSYSQTMVYGITHEIYLSTKITFLEYLLTFLRQTFTSRLLIYNDNIILNHNMIFRTVYEKSQNSITNKVLLYIIFSFQEVKMIHSFYDKK